MGNHAVSTTEGVLHRPPDVVFWCRLLVPDVTGVAVEVTRGESVSDVLGVTDGATSGVDKPGAL